MLEEPTHQSGVGGSISRATTLYLFKDYQYIFAFEAIFFIILTIMLIAPSFVMAIVSKCIVIPPDIIIAIIATFTDPLLHVPLIIVALVMSVLCTHLFIARAQYKYVLSSDGICYSNPVYSIYSPWENVVGFKNVKFGRFLLKGLKLAKEFQHDATIEEGRQHRFPVFEHKNPFRAKRNLSKEGLVRFSASFGVNTFPLSGMSNKKRVKKKLVAAIRLHAPHILRMKSRKVD